MTTKTCTRCHESKQEAMFFADQRNFGGREAQCKGCRRTRINHHAPGRRLGKYKDNARARGIQYALSREEFMAFWQKPCYFCDAEIATVGIDRVDNTQGYVAGNCVSCCAECNRAKGTETCQEFLARCRRIASRHPGARIGEEVDSHI